jgi:hypothetical protein
LPSFSVLTLKVNTAVSPTVAHSAHTKAHRVLDKGIPSSRIYKTISSALTFKRPFTYVNLYTKAHLEINFLYLGNKKIFFRHAA